MNIFNILNKLKEEDVPIKEFKNQKKIQSYLRLNDDDVSYDDIIKNTGLSKEQILDTHTDASLFFKDEIAPKVFFKAMVNSDKNDSEEFKQLFQRSDVDLCLLMMFKISDTKKRMRNLNTPQYVFLYDNWKKYRGY